MIGVIFVSYNPDSTLIDACGSIQNQVDATLVIDNGSTQGLEFLDLVSDKGCHVIRLGENKGVAYAYNFGIRELISRGIDEFVISDQDTIYDASFIQAMTLAASSQGNAILGANIFDQGKGLPKKIENFNTFSYTKREVVDSVQRCSIVISSGSYFAKSVYSLVGPFKDELFIDYVDTEYCMRAKKKGVEVFVVKEAKAFHSLGYVSIQRFLAWSFYPKNYSLFRRQYIYRNRVICWFQAYGLGYLLWDISAMLYDIVMVLMFERNKFKKIGVSSLGLVNGFYFLIERTFKH